MNRFSFIILIISVFSLLAMRSLIRTENNNKSNIEYSYLTNEKLPPSLLMYYSLLHFSKKYNVPKDYAFAVAYIETGYRGPFDWAYKHNQISSAGAVGPMQLLPSTANWIAGKKYSDSDIRNNIPLNVELSMKYIHYLKGQYKDWKLVFGYYNTGYPLVNDYAIQVHERKYIWNKF